MTRQHDSDQSDNHARLIQSVDSLVEAIQGQAQAIQALAQSNSDLVQALMDIADEGETELPGLYLDGSKAPR